MRIHRRPRSREHHAAHAEVSTGMPALDLIADTQKLGEFAAHVRERGSFAFDTEFIGENAYHPRTCLIQLATDERVALIDPIALRDVSIAWELVGDRSIETIVHAGASDLSPVRRHLGRAPENVVDVQVAAGFTGMPYPLNLAKLVERFSGQVIAKGFTFTDWEARPLSPSQLRYAADDVRHLPLVWKALREDLEKRGRLAWVAQETLARTMDPHVFDLKAQVDRARSGFNLTTAQRNLMEALVGVRDQIARQENLPWRTTMPDGSLLEIARLRPTSVQGLMAVRGFPRPIASRHGNLILSALAAHPDRHEKWAHTHFRHPRGKGWKETVTALLASAEKASTEAGIAPMLVLTRADAERHLSNGGKTPLFAPGDWRAEAFGDRIERPVTS